jgi:pantoate--beta-alanine ligase
VTIIVSTRAEFARARAQLPDAIGLVPTMGALHAGHRALLEAARRSNAAVVATIFVNPLQFGPAEDLERYPRSLDADIELCRAAGVDVVWAPSVEEVYLAGSPQVVVSAGALGSILEGAARPGHFTGMLTVVAKLLNSTRAVRAYFGEKDYQQLTLIRRMVIDLDLGVEVIGVPTVREPDGLALSSRNIYLSAGERAQASALFRALTVGAAQAARDGAEGRGGNDSAQVLAAARQVLLAAQIEPDYLELLSADLGPVSSAGPARLLVAARVGAPRLIDNVAVTL